MTNKNGQTMSLPTAEQIEKMTPMMKQYYEIKSGAKGAIVFFRMGDFYEIFGDDAQEIAPVLEIVLTSRERGDKNRIPFCGVPHHAAKNYWLKLLKQGYKVAIADQVEDPATAKGLVKREIVRIFTPGCIDELEGLKSELPNFIMAAYEDPAAKTWAITVADISTGSIRLGTVTSLAELRSAVGEFKPKELLVRRFALESIKELLNTQQEEDGLLIETLPEQSLSDTSLQNSVLNEVFGTSDLSQFPCCSLLNSNKKKNHNTIAGGKEVLSSLFLHLKSLSAKLNGFRSIQPLYDPETMQLGDTVIRDLELFETTRRREAKGSLFHQINRTLSPMGARLTRWSLARPLLNQSSIEARHNATERFIKLGEAELGKLREMLGGSFDLERLSTRVLSGSAYPHELAKIRSTLRNIKEISAFLTKHNFSTGLLSDKQSNPLADLNKFAAPLKVLETALIETPESLGKGNLVFSNGYDSALDGLIELSQNGKEQVANYEQKLREQTKINNLKIKPHKTFGLLIEVTKSNISKVPDSFIRRQTMVNCDRFATDELKDLDETLASAQENAVAKELELYHSLLQSLALHAESIYTAAAGLAQIDMLQSFAWLALQENYCKPEISDKQVFSLKNSRHPVVEYFVGKHAYVANHIKMNAANKHLLITGPNMAGKSTVMRQTALCAIMNQAGCYVPAQAAVMPVFDQIYTRVGASDDLSKGQSTFMVEMSEAATIMRQASKNSLVILDEVGRGTSTQDGLAIASAILENLAEDINCWSMFATHYHELAEISKRFDHVKNMKTEVIEKPDGIEFSHRLTAGVSGSSFGIEVAKLAGVPENVISKAQQYLSLNAQIAETPQKTKAKNSGQLELGLEEIFDSLEGQNNKELQSKESQRKEPQLPHISEILSKIEGVDMDHMTPMAAFNILNEFKELSKSGELALAFKDQEVPAKGSTH